MQGAPHSVTPQLGTSCLLAMLVLAGMPLGCREGSTSGNGKSIELVAPEVDVGEAFTVARGDTVEIRWTPPDPDFAVWLVYRDTTMQDEQVITANAEGGAHNWTIPAELAGDADYEIREYDPEDGTLLARSATFRVVDSGNPPDDGNSNGLSTGAACTGDRECDDGQFCNGAETCLAGACTNGIAPCTADRCNETSDTCAAKSCQSDDDCASDEGCAAGSCIPVNPGSNGLAGYAFFAATDVAVDFDVALVVGDMIRLVSPASGATPPTARVLDSACTCAWSVQPADAGAFDSPDACSTGFDVATAGAFDLLLDTDCAGTRLRYRQRARAEAPPPDLPGIELLAADLLPPYVIRLNLRLTDASGAVIPSGVTADDFRIFENGALVDFTETNRFVVPAENLPLRVVLVLDYTTSMTQAGAVAAMIEAATNFVAAEHFTATHSFAVVEFHDRTPEGEGYSLVVPLTAASAQGKSVITTGIPRASDLEAGLTRVWDALDLALATLKEPERKTGEAQAIVFLTDGRDTTSDAAPLALAADAAENDIALYPVGFGDVTQTQNLLEDMAEQTGGSYFPATGSAALAGVFAEIARNLRGQWNLSYVTPRNGGGVTARVEFDWQGQTASLETQFEAGQFAGDIHEGRIAVRDRAYNEFTDRTEFLLQAVYIPRNIDRLRFRFAHSNAQFDLQTDGGLTDPADGWSLTPTGNGSFLLLNPAALEYGAFGNLGIASVPGDVPVLQVTHDDSLFDLFSQPKSFVFEGDLWAAPYILTTAASPAELGLVLRAPDKTGYGHGESVTLTAIGTNGVFEDWSGDASGEDNSVEVIMDGDKSAVANFTNAP